jgi:hypothetical protein
MRGLMRRVASAWLGVWLTFVVAEPVPVHACAMHDGHAAVPAGGVASANAHDEHHQHGASATAHGGEQAAPSEDGTAPASHGGCLCLGDCCAAAVQLAPAAPEVAVAGHLRDAEASPAHRASAAATRASQVRLPWANGPPRFA